jgi:hypothetical protein
MGRSKPSVQVPHDVREEAALARVLEEAAARVLPAKPAEIAEDEVDDTVDSVLSEVARVAQPGQITLPIVLLDGFEIIQEIQDTPHSVPLVARKATIVRAYLSLASGPVTVRAELLVGRSPLGPWQAVPSIGTADLDPSRSGADVRSRRADFGFSLNFRIPPQLAGEGTVFLRMGAIRRGTGTPLPSLAWLRTRTVVFKQPTTLRIRLVRVRYTMGNPPTTYEPSSTDTVLIESWLARAYPASQVEMSTTTITANATAPFTADQINAQLIALRAVDVSTGTDARTHYYGMVADGGFFMRGKASGIPQTPQPETVASGPTGASGFSWDTDGSYGDWYGGHELGHTFGRFHAEFCGATGGAPYPFPNGQLADADDAFIGIDVGDPALSLPIRLMDGVTCHDVMSYCDNEWLSSFTYAGIYDRLVAEDALAAGANARQEPGMRIVGALNLTRKSGSIASVLPADQVSDAPAREAGPSTVTVRLLDATGAVLDDRPANFQPSACEDPDDDDTGTVDVLVPDRPGAARVELLVDGQVVASEEVGGQPVVGDLVHSARTAVDPVAPGQDLELRWEAPDAPAGQRYIVQLSDDGGDSWRTVAVGLPEPAVTLPAQELTGDTVTVRILATTGTGTSVVRTETVPLT